VDGAPRPNAIELLVLQGTSFCNIDCSYCYLPGRLDKRRMSQNVLSAVLAKVFGSRFVSGALTVFWHAGEPLVLPRSLYARAMDMAADLAPPGLSVTHNIQTDGLLLDEASCRFIAERGVRLGLSPDGPAFLHDAARRTRSGAGTHARVMRSVALLRSEGVPFHVITVLRRESLAHADALFDFYLAHGIREVALQHRGDRRRSPGVVACRCCRRGRVSRLPGAVPRPHARGAGCDRAAGAGLGFGRDRRRPAARLQPGGRSVSDPLRHA